MKIIEYLGQHWGKISIVLYLIIFCYCHRSIAAEGDKGKPEFAFGVIADVQYCDCDHHGTRFFRESLKKLTDAVQDLNTQELAFVIQVGDFIDRDFKSFDAVLPLYEKIKVPTYHILGNHDFVVQQEKKFQVPKKLGLEKGYYDFAYHAWRFIVLDGNDLSFYVIPEEHEKYDEVETLFQRVKSEGRPNAQEWNGGLSHEQLTWLENTLDSAFKKNENVVLFCHFPTFPPDMHNVWNDAELVRLLDSYPNVVAYLNGHNHAGNYEENNGVHYLNLQGMVETKDTTAYAIIEVYADHLKVIGKGREPNRNLLIK